MSNEHVTSDSVTQTRERERDHEYSTLLCPHRWTHRDNDSGTSECENPIEIAQAHSRGASVSCAYNDMLVANWTVS